MRRILDLGGMDWQFGSVSPKPFGDVDDTAEVDEWLTAQVPGDVRLDLLRAGKIADPFFGDNNTSSQWVDGRDWWYRKDIDLSPGAEERAFLVFEGIDYQSAVLAGDAQLGRHRGMFSRQVYELPPSKRERATIGVRIWGSDALPKMHLTRSQRFVRPFLDRLQAPNQAFPDRYATLKCQMQFGWDFAPRLRTCGIWDAAYIVVARSVFIRDVWVRSTVNGEHGAGTGSAQVELTMQLDSSHAQDVRATATVRGRNFESAPRTFEFALRLAAGHQSQPVTFQLPHAVLWEPWDRGSPNLYDINVELRTRDSSQILDTCTTAHGIRSIELRESSTARNEEPWNFIINGRREFIRGANWVPLDAIPGRLSRDEYAARLQQAREANVNFLRVWGGGLREKRAFYELCDELGILVWQEFPFAGAILDRFPGDPAFLALVQEECAAIVRAIRNHPSLVVWCGGNEFNTRGNRAIVDTLRAVVAMEDGTRPYKPASPYDGESHNWRVWHRGANFREYRKDRTPFLSEFGLQSPPEIDSLKQFLPADGLFPPNVLWEYHHAQLKKLWRYARNGKSTLASFVETSQRAQAQGVQVAIEHMRRRKARCEAGTLGDGAAGVAVWQLNDAWPAISWSLIDYFGRPKAAYAMVRRLYAPVLVSLDYPLQPHRPGDTVHGDVWLINDLSKPVGSVEWRAELNNRPVGQGQANLTADVSVCVGSLDVLLRDGTNQLRMAVFSAGQMLSENEYDLNYCDVGEMSPFVALLYPIYDALMR